MDEDAVAARADLTAKTVGGVAAGGLGVAAVALLGPAGVLVAPLLSPTISEGLKRTLEAVIDRRLSRVATAVACAETEAGCSVADLVLHAGDDDRRMEIIGQALHAAALAEDDQVVRALGRALASGVLAADDAKVDVELRIVSTLAQLEPVDVRVLHLMADGHDTWIKRSVDEGGGFQVVAEIDPGVEPVVDAVFSRLEMLGLISSDASGMRFQTMWKVSPFGHTCLQALQAVGKMEATQDGG